MKALRLVAPAAVVLACLAPASADASSTFDPDAAVVRLPTDALRTFDFESADALVGLELGQWDTSQSDFLPTLTRTPIAKADDVAALLTQSSDDAVEGRHALRLGVNGTGLVIADAPLFAGLADKKFEITYWARSDGTSAQLFVTYDNDPAKVFAGTNLSFATVRAIRTGRETSDGWAELSTGPLDGNVWGVPVRAITIMPGAGANATDAFLVDALEIHAVAGKPIAPRACTQATVDAVCGVEGDCMYGHCVPSTVTWGVLPPTRHRREIAQRWTFFATRLIGDRNAAKHGLDLLAPQAALLAESAPSSRQFFGGMNRLVNLLRDNHTSFGSPGNFTRFAPQDYRSSTGVIGACFGLVEKDIMGGGLGYAVFRLAPEDQLTGLKLQIGDVLVAIDGQDPKAWVDENYPRFATTLPNDPAADWAASANDLSGLVTSRASTITLNRCSSASSCDAAHRQEITIDIAKVTYAALLAGKQTPKQYGCTQRFSEVATGGGGFSGEDAVRTATSPTGTALVSFDGFVGQTKWPAAMKAVFDAHPATVVMDARMGHGGYETTVQVLLDLLRGTSEPSGVVSLGRGTYDLLDPPWLGDPQYICGEAGASDWTCLAATSEIFTKSSAPSGGTSKVAWLNTYDVSANDFMPRLLKGRSNFKIFAPHATSGAFGAIMDLPGLATNWSGGSMQYQDSHFAPTKQDAKVARWESGHGVEPDVVVAEKLSDALSGVDTIVKAATDWLASP